MDGSISGWMDGFGQMLYIHIVMTHDRFCHDVFNSHFKHNNCIDCMDEWADSREMGEMNGQSP